MALAGGAFTAYGLYSGSKGMIEGVQNRNLAQTAGGAITAGLSVLPFTRVGKGLNIAARKKVVQPAMTGVNKVIDRGVASKYTRKGLQLATENVPYVAAYTAADAMMGTGESPGGYGAAAGMGAAPGGLGPQGMDSTGSPSAGSNVASPYAPQMQFGQQQQEPGFNWQ